MRMSARDALEHAYFAADPLPFIAPIDLSDRRDPDRQRREAEREREKEREKERQREERAKEKIREELLKKRSDMRSDLRAIVCAFFVSLRGCVVCVCVWSQLTRLAAQLATDLRVERAARRPHRPHRPRARPLCSRLLRALCHLSTPLTRRSPTSLCLLYARPRPRRLRLC